MLFFRNEVFMCPLEAKFNRETFGLLNGYEYFCIQLKSSMKKAISIFFILLANVAILAHAVVPHHHHNKIFAAIVNVLDGEAQDTLNHHHDGAHPHETNPEECTINETLVAAASRLQKDNSLDFGAFDFDSHLDLFVTDIVAAAVPEPVGDLPFIPKPYIAGNHRDFVARAIGLRAPPAC